MKHSQNGFIIPLVLIIVAIIAIGGTVYYQHKERSIVDSSINTNVSVDHQNDVEENQKPTPIEKPVVIVNFETKARAAAQTSECTMLGTIGAAIKIDEGDQYATFTINNSKIPTTRNTCVVDLYAGTVEAPFVTTPESIPGPRKTEDISIHTARAIAEKGDCGKEGKVTSYVGYMNFVGGGKASIFRVNSMKNGNEIGQCIVNSDQGTSQFNTPTT